MQVKAPLGRYADVLEAKHTARVTPTQGSTGGRTDSRAPILSESVAVAMWDRVRSDIPSVGFME